MNNYLLFLNIFIPLNTVIYDTHFFKKYNNNDGNEFIAVGKNIYKNTLIHIQRRYNEIK